MVDIGSIIKLQRTKRNMTQGELSEGIVSLSYLSKIENKKTKASPEIIQLLCNRLEIELTDTTDVQIAEKCQEWYGMLFDHFDKQEMVTKYEELENLMDRSINDQTLMFEIHKIRYYCVLRDFVNALYKINELHEMAASFNPTLKYYWYKFKGNYYSFQEDHQHSMQYYKLAEESTRLANINNEEVADLQYAISIEHSKLWEDLEAIEYAKQAMEVFQSNYNFIRCAQCHILLGIAYQRIKKPDISMKNYNLALKLAELSNNEDVTHLTHYNLGYLHSIMRNSEEAIKHYLIAIQNKNLTDKPKLEALTRLIQELYTIGDYDNAKEYLQHAKEILNLTDKRYYTKLYDYILQVYTCLLDGDLKQFKSVLADDFIPYLKRKEEFQHLVFYAKMLAVHLEKIGKYKASVQYYKLANSSYDQLIIL
ncbi:MULTISPECIES: helix-turn-helix transcriptional regulator [Clostridia]|uniref:helix-turn-helix domain-containing protein n=1 Tax=Clostridia TaxID=186801 RepID=UPI000EA178CA|nr:MULTISPECIES: helix-turn-helix transcriptional regulator [Clostridia]NBJ69954.1 XRE family transcriptional regulator [Roseburia sp. 1XD42-34]RKI77525.1 XRE family transcriptional regulator [Clostridium sp. 1xD42-85]